MIIFDFQTVFLEERMNISDRLHELRTSYGMSLRHDWFLTPVFTEHKEQRTKKENLRQESDINRNAFHPTGWCRGKALDFYSEGARSESRPGHWLP
jgi:hypothetical protein